MIKRIFLMLLTITILITLIACQNNKVQVTLVNPDFEIGNLDGWTSEGDAFIDSVTNDIYFDGLSKYMQQKNYHITTKSKQSIGYIESNPFTLSGLGYISFLIGGQSDLEDTYLAIIDVETSEVLESFNNYNYDGELFTDNYTRMVCDATAYLGQTVAIRIVDNDSQEGYINIDDIDVYIETEEELELYRNDSLVRLGYRTDDLLMSAEYYINLHKAMIDPSSRYTYHVMGELGWINDPNGFVYYQNDYHLFYQHNPYSPLWGPMHWGHVKSDDLIKWEYLPIAVAPIIFDAGGGAAFSGSAIEVDGSLYIMYTENWPGYQYQVIAKSEDGIIFDRINDGNPVIDETLLPWYTNPVDFRDPKIWEENGIYYAVVGSRQINNFGQVLMFKSDNLLDWQLVGPVIQGSQNTLYTLGYMFECPDMFELNGKDVLIMSPQQIPGHRNTHGTVYVVGDLDYESGALSNWNLGDIEEIDYGFDFYAPQTMIDDQGRRIMIAWMQSWNRSPMTAGLGWAGAMTIPRELTLSDDGKLIQYPVIELENYRRDQVDLIDEVFGTFDTGFSGNTIDINVSFQPGQGKTGITLFADENGNGTHVYYENGFIYLNRTDNMGGRFPGDNNQITKAPITLDENGEIVLRILLDRHSIEVFVNGGQRAITSTIYFNELNNRIFLFADEQTTFNFSKWNLVIED